MFRANITRDEANTRSQQLRVASYDALVDLSGRRPDGAPLAEPEATFVSTTTVRFGSIACVTNANVIAEEILSATLDGEAIPAEAFDGEHLTLDLSESDHELVVSAVMRFSRTGEGLHRFVDPVDGEDYLYTQFEVADARRIYAVVRAARPEGDVPADGDRPARAGRSSPTPRPSTPSGSATGWPVATSRRPRASPPTSPRSSPATSTSVTDELRAPRRQLDPAVDRTCRRRWPSTWTPTTSSRPPSAASTSSRRTSAVPYPFDDYDQLFVPEFNAGAMENAGCVTFRDEYVFRSPSPPALRARATTRSCTRWPTCGSATSSR